MSLLSLCKWKVIAGTLLIWAVKLYIRPNFHSDPVMIYILGVAPNLIGSYVLLFGAYWFLNSRLNFNSPYYLKLLCLAFFLLLVINEYLQKIPVFGRTFDYNDILFSAVGLVAGHTIFNKNLLKEHLKL
jgi:hypothetical protein